MQVSPSQLRGVCVCWKCVHWKRVCFLTGIVVTLLVLPPQQITALLRLRFITQLPHTHTHRHTHTHTHTHTLRHTHTQTHTLYHTHIYTNTHTHTHTITHSYTYTHRHTHPNPPASFPSLLFIQSLQSFAAGAAPL